jgi:hypothetical protein
MILFPNKFCCGEITSSRKMSSAKKKRYREEEEPELKSKVKILTSWSYSSCQDHDCDKGYSMDPSVNCWTCQATNMVSAKEIIQEVLPKLQWVAVFQPTKDSRSHPTIFVACDGPHVLDAQRICPKDYELVKFELKNPWYDPNFLVHASRPAAGKTLEDSRKDWDDVTKGYRYYE